MDAADPKPQANLLRMRRGSLTPGDQPGLQSLKVVTTLASGSGFDGPLTLGPSSGGDAEPLSGADERRGSRSRRKADPQTPTSISSTPVSELRGPSKTELDEDSKIQGKCGRVPDEKRRSKELSKLTLGSSDVETYRLLPRTSSAADAGPVSPPDSASKDSGSFTNMDDASTRPGHRDVSFDLEAAMIKGLTLDDGEAKKKKKSHSPRALGADSEPVIPLLKSHPQGTRVQHPKRGLGTVGALDLREKRSKQITVVFDTGDTHHYSDESAKKIRVVDAAYGYGTTSSSSRR